MKYASFAAAVFAAVMALCPISAPAANNVTFLMTQSSPACGKGSFGRVTISTVGALQNMHVEVFGLPKNTGFDLFVIQVPKAPFGMSWYQGDVDTDNFGRGVADFVGVFSIETFVVAPGVAPAPVVFPSDANSNPQTKPIQMYHLGLWFNSPADAVKAGCANTVTPFNGEHNAGVQVLNTATFPDLFGPLRTVH